MICISSQGYYDNFNPLYVRSGLKSHGGEDEVCGYGTPVECLLDMYVYKILDDQRPSNDGTGFWGIFGIGTFKGQLGELCLGHCSKIICDIGQNVTEGQVIAEEGNHGQVYAGKIEITKAMQQAGDHRGSHRHWQWRPLKKSQAVSSAKNYITNFGGSIYRDKDGSVYEIPDYNNGNHGLSPDISSIMTNYDEFKMNRSIMEATVPEKKLFIKILETFKEILTAVFNKRNE